MFVAYVIVQIPNTYTGFVCL